MPDERRDDVSRVLSAIGDAGARIDPALLRLFLEELFRWNSQLGLVSKRDTAGVVVRLIQQGVRLWDFACGAVGDTRLAGIERIVDIGSGGGFPGLVWKMLSPSREFLLIERKQRKATFLERVIARTQLSGISAAATDLDEVARREGVAGRFDLAVMTAVAEPVIVAASIERLLRAVAYFCTVRGREQGIPGERLGRRLELLAYSDTPDGRFLIYKTSASA